MKIVNEYCCEICGKRFPQALLAEECETKHKGDLCFQNINTFKDVLDQLFLKLEMTECECKCELHFDTFWITLPIRLKNIHKKHNLPYWIAYVVYSNTLRINLERLSKLVPAIAKDYKEYRDLVVNIYNAQKNRDSDYWELNRKVRQLLKSNDEFKELEKEIARITARMSQIKSQILTEQEQTFPKNSIKKYAELTSKLHQRQKEWRLK